MWSVDSETLVRAWRSMDAGHKLVLGAFLALVALFHVLAPLYPKTKQRAWILTAAGSAALTIFSAPFVVNLIALRGDVTDLVQIPWWSETACRVFQAYLLSDLAVGSVYYPSHINIATGWGHHIIYTILVESVVRWQWTHIFVLAGVMELPTFLLAIASMYRELRNDILFASTFFATRICFHLVLLASYLPYSTRVATVQGSFWPSGLFALAFPMHAMWFTGCIKGFMKRAEARRLAASLPVPAAAPVEKPVEIVVHSNSSTPSTFDIQAKPIAKPKEKKAYPPSSLSLPSTSMPHFPPRIVPLSPSTRARSRSSSTASTSSPSSPVTLTVTPSSFLQRPPMAPRRRSLVSAEREESLRKLAAAIAELAEEALAASPTVQSAVAVGKGVARRYNAYRGRATGLRQRAFGMRDPVQAVGISSAVEAY